ncbi:MAG: hypothetical protein FWD13_04925 [Treponema sp.]|nr:hypothetical protein [Treponema sp.]
MKQKIAFIVCVFLIFAMTGCGDSKYPLNGVWTGVFDGDDITMAFIEDICIITPATLFSSKRIAKYSYTYEKGNGAINVSDNLIVHFTVKGKDLTMVKENISFTVRKDTKIKAANKAVRGIWKGPENRLLAFVNDSLYYYDEDDYIDYGTFTFDKNSGSAEFKRGHLYDSISFTVNGDSLAAVIKHWNDEDNINFTKAK